MHSFQNFIVRLIPNHPPPLETRIWKLVVRALIAGSGYKIAVEEEAISSLSKDTIGSSYEKGSEIYAEDSEGSALTVRKRYINRGSRRKDQRKKSRKE